jgi:rhamnogalacturonyl hydrolase YesR
VKSKPIRFVIISCLAAVIDFVSGCAHLGKTDAELAMPKPDAILSVMQRVADWQLAHPSLHRADDWTQAAGYVGMMALTGISGDAKYQEAMLAMGSKSEWKLGPRKYHADDQAVGQTYAELYLRYRDPATVG